MPSNLPSNLPRPVQPSPTPAAAPPAMPAVPLPRQEAEFTAEGSPPPGRVGLQAPVDAATDAPSAADPGADPGAGTAPADELSAHRGPQAAGRTSVTPEHTIAVPPAAHRAAQVVGEVHARQGDGVNILVPKGPCVVRLTELDATISWGDAAAGSEAHGVVAIPLTDFERLLKRGAITM